MSNGGGWSRSWNTGELVAIGKLGAGFYSANPNQGGEELTLVTQLKFGELLMILGCCKNDREKQLDVVMGICRGAFGYAYAYRLEDLG